MSIFSSGNAPEILTTPVVISKLRQGKFPTAVRQWADAPPTWLRIESPLNVQFLDLLDDGEATTLSLAIERQAAALLVDERKPTQVARDHGFITAGTLAVMRDAAFTGLVDFHQTIDRLARQTEFRHTSQLIERVLIDFDSAMRVRKQNDAARDDSAS